MITVKEFLKLNINCYIRINGDTISIDNHKYDDWIIDGASIDAYFKGYISTDANDNLNYSEFYLYISANEPKK